MTRRVVLPLQNDAGMKRRVVVLLLSLSASAFADVAPPLGVQLTSPEIAHVRHMRNVGVGILVAGGVVTLSALFTSIAFGLGATSCIAGNLLVEHPPCARSLNPIGEAALGLAIAGVPALLGGAVLTGVEQRRLKHLLHPSIELRRDRGATDGAVLQLGARF